MSTSVETRPGRRDDPDDPDVDTADADLKVVPARHPWRWAGTVVVAVLAAMAINALVTNPAWDWPTVGLYLFAPSIVRAVLLTLELTALGIVVGFVLGTLLALMRMSPNPLLRSVSWTYIWIFRSVPLILQLLFWFNLALLYRAISFGVPFGPGLFEIGTMDLVSPVTAAVLGLGLHQGAYAAEVVRSGFLGVDQGQLEAAAALGIPHGRRFRRIQLPQAMRIIVPTAANELIGLVKGTSVVYIMALSELFYQVQVIYTRTGRVIPMLLVAAIWYLVLTTVLSVGQFYVERHYGKGAQRALPPTPIQRLRSGAIALYARVTR